jgi:Na+-translocating ferredoxin:NAD+ oxidoreductase RnfD subunit
VRRFFATPKGLLTIVFAILSAIAVPVEGLDRVAPGLLAATLIGMIVDAPILRLRGHAWAFPTGALLTGWIVAFVLSPFEPWYVVAITTIVGVLSKYVFRLYTANIFNPAALAIVISTHAFGTGHNWWGALPDVTPLAILVLIATGVFISDRVNKMPLVLAFLGTHFLLFTMTAFVSDPTPMVEIFIAPDLHMALFFAFFILTDPPTAPTQYRDQLLCGVLVAVVGYLTFTLTGAVYFLLAGVLVGNVWEAWRRWRARQARQAAFA